MPLGSKENTVVLGCEKRTALKLQDPRITPSKICKVDHHILFSICWFECRCQNIGRQGTSRSPIPQIDIRRSVSVEYLTKYVAGVQQKYTQLGGVRPFGIATLIAGFDVRDDVPKLFQTEPSGVFNAWKAHAIGRSSKQSKNF